MKVRPSVEVRDGADLSPVLKVGLFHRTLDTEYGTSVPPPLE